METVNASSVRLLSGDCLEVLRTLEADSVDAVVTDPPYGLSREPDIAEVLTKWLAGEDYKHRGGGFMGRSWDSFVPGPSVWREVFRVMKPGAHLLCFAGTRTADLMGISLRLAGFEVRDTLQWVYGSGFPKSHNISKAIDRMAGAEREKVGQGKGRTGPAAQPHGGSVHSDDNFQWPGEFDITAPATQAAKQWEGFGTALKPSHEPILLCRKPLSESSVARNVLEHGTGAINVDATRVGTTREVPASLSKNKTPNGIFNEYGGGAEKELNPNQGRWSPNLLLSHSPGCVPTGERRRVKGAPGGKSERNEKHTEEWWGQGGGGFKSVGRSTVSHADPDGYESIEEVRCVPGCPVREMDEQSGMLKSGGKAGKVYATDFEGSPGWGNVGKNGSGVCTGDSGGASRFYPNFQAPLPDTGAGFLYKSKASRAERNKGLEGMPEKPCGTMQDDNYKWTHDGKGNKINLDTKMQNSHPTVKPLALMDWLITLITPPGGTCLDPFMGSGSTGCSAARLGFDFIGIEMEEEYLEIARRRIAYWSQPEEVRATDKGKAPAKKRNDRTLFANGTVRRCPDHDNPIPSGSNSYSCGCAIQYGKTNGKIAESHSQPDTSLF